MRYRLGLLVTLVSSLVPNLAAAEEDYDPTNQSWNGLSRLTEILVTSGYLFTIEKQLDWGELSPNDIPLFFYPKRVDEPAPDPGKVADFLRLGGKVMIADDFGAAAGTLAALGISRSAALPTNVESYGDNPALPFAEPVPGHSLGAGVDLLLTNHPAVFHSALTPAFVLGRPPLRADPDEKLDEVVVEGGLGEGRIIAVSDPSIFINAMLAYPGNETFVRNLLAHLAGQAPGKGLFRIYVGHFGEWGGAGDAPQNLNETAAQLQDFLKAFNDWLGDLSLYSPKGELARVMAALLVFSGFMALLARLAQATTRYDGHWLGAARESGPLSPSTPRSGLSDEDILGASFQIQVERFLLPLDPPLEQRLPKERRRLRALLGQIRALPSRVKPERIAPLYQEWLSLLTAAELLDPWKRRGRG